MSRTIRHVLTLAVIVNEHILSALSAGEAEWFPVATSIYTLGFTHTNLINCPGDKEACIMFRVQSVGGP